MASKDVLVGFILERVSQDVSFLASHGYISREDAGSILERLTAACIPATPLMNAKTEPTNNLAAPPSYAHVPSNMPTPNENPALKRAVPPPPVRQVSVSVQYCRALWDYNTDGSEPNDLVFYKGDIIALESETNADWWNGTTRGRTGLFPSNHAERIPYDPSIVVTSADTKSQYHHMYSKPHYPAGGSTTAPPPAQPWVATGENGEGGRVEGKQPKGQGLRGQMGNAMANGLGFGAGAAVGAGVINAIF